MKICVVSLYTPEIEEMGKIMEANRQQYCRKHGYGWRCPHKRLAPERHPMWSKLLILQQTIAEQKFDWIMWTDADSLVMNMDFRIEYILDQVPSDVHLVVTKDRYYGFNSGQFFIRSCDWSYQLLKRAYENHPELLDHWVRDQGAMRLEMEKEPQHVLWLPKRLFNSYIHPVHGGEFHHGDFILHFAGLPKHRLLACMQRLQFEDGAVLVSKCRSQLHFVQGLIGFGLLLCLPYVWSHKRYLPIWLICIVLCYFMCFAIIWMI